jgi:hypothetical protein
LNLLLSAGGGSNDSYDIDDLSLDGMDFLLVQAVPTGDLDVPSGDLFYLIFDTITSLSIYLIFHAIRFCYDDDEFLQ